jgi:hypothetical protein
MHLMLPHLSIIPAVAVEGWKRALSAIFDPGQPVKGFSPGPKDFLQPELLMETGKRPFSRGNESILRRNDFQSQAKGLSRRELSNPSKGKGFSPGELSISSGKRPFPSPKGLCPGGLSNSSGE